MDYTSKMSNAERVVLEKLLAEVRRKLWLARTSRAALTRTNDRTINLREMQIAVLMRILGHATDDGLPNRT